MPSETYQQDLPAVFTEMLRSFVALARNLNLGKTVRELGVTRQTISRHIKQLEECKGVKLFSLVDRQYQLTEAGKTALQSAESLLESSTQWISERSNTPIELAKISLKFPDGGYYNAQQHPIHHIWEAAPPLIKRGFQDWAVAQGQLESRALRKVRPYLLVYRPNGEDWTCMEVGEKSSYTSWIGWRDAKSSIGRNLALGSTYAGADQFMIQAYSRVLTLGNPWYDHVNANFPRQPGATPEAVNYQRLVSPCTLPDGTMVVSVLVARTDDVKIDRLKPHQIPRSNPEDLMEFEI